MRNGLSLVFKYVGDGFGGHGGPGPPWPCSGGGLRAYFTSSRSRRQEVHAWERPGRPLSSLVRTHLPEAWARDPPAPASGPPRQPRPCHCLLRSRLQETLLARSNFIWESRAVAIATPLTSEGLGPEISRKGGGVEEGRPRERRSLTLCAPAPSGRARTTKFDILSRLSLLPAARAARQPSCWARPGATPVPPTPTAPR